MSWDINQGLLEPRRCEPCRGMNKLNRTSSTTISNSSTLESHEDQATDPTTSTNRPSLEGSSSLDSTYDNFRENDPDDKSNQEEARVEPNIKQGEYLKDKRLLQDLENVSNYNQQD